MKNFIEALKRTAVDEKYDYAYDEIANNYRDYTKGELAAIIKGLLFAISDYDEKENILLDAMYELEDRYEREYYEEE